MSNLFDRFKAKNNAAGAAKASLFLTENNANGYMSKNDLSIYLNQLTATDFLRFERMFELMFKRFPINNYIHRVIDKIDNEEVLWLKFKLPNSQQNVRIIYDKDILRFIQDYQEGKFRNGFELEALILEAELALETEA